MLFTLAYTLSWLLNIVRRRHEARSPFATAANPPQLVPPDELVSD